jgi:glycosyltransferase involved in cell wall biosynthesis
MIEQLPADGRSFERKRDFARTVGRLSPAVRSAAHRAALSLATTDDSRRAIESLTRRPWERCGPVRLLSNCALPEADLDQFTAVSRNPTDFNVVCVGRLEHWKGFHLAVSAFAAVAAELPHAALHIVGEGPADAYLRGLVRQLALEQRVTFHGRLPRADVLDRLEQSHVLVHPSLHDSAGWATLEAAGAGLPVVCLDIGGPAFQVTDETGIKIPVDDADSVIPRIATALLTLARDPQRAATLGAAGRRRVEQSFTWSRIGDQLATMGPYGRAAAFVEEPSG